MGVDASLLSKTAPDKLYVKYPVCMIPTVIKTCRACTARPKKTHSPVESLISSKLGGLVPYGVGFWQRLDDEYPTKKYESVGYFSRCSEPQPESPPYKTENYQVFPLKIKHFPYSNSGHKPLIC
jgi:hypothetical protein